MASPVDRVLQTYELLEQVLHQLPLKDLFVIQRVSRIWADLINHSDCIQKKMFLRPTGEAQLPEATLFTKWTYTQTPTFQTNDVTEIEVWSNWHGSCPAPIGSREAADAAWCSERDIDLWLITTVDATSLYEGYPHGSWRRMLITQPPITAVELTGVPVVLNHAAGVTLGDVIELAEQVGKEYDVEPSHFGSFEYGIGGRAARKAHRREGDDGKEIDAVSQCCERAAELLAGCRGIQHLAVARVVG